jgi:ABC-type polysaccharide/polyol phosphate transport system ATPase subunit
MAEAIVIDGVTKEFTLRHAHSIKEMTVRALRRQSLSEQFRALDDVSLTIEQGEAVALMGLNGSGKSTLLKLISGVMQPDGGSVRVRGKVAGLIEVGAGLHPDLTGRENVYLNAAILGMNRKETDRRFDAIIDFSGIERFLDTQVKFYSSGMFMRLGFSVAVHTDPDIFLVDEALAVGDAPFQKKCLGRIKELHAEGRTLVIVSHEMATLKKVCSRGAVLAEGALTFDGDISRAIRTVLGTGSTTVREVPSRQLGVVAPGASPSARTHYLVGATGYPNYGDELIAAAWLKHLAVKAPDAEVWLDCPHPGSADVMLGHLHPKVRFTDTFWRLCWEAPSDDPRRVADFAREAIGDPGRAPRWSAGLRLAGSADTVHVMGGGYMNDVWPRHLGLIAAAGAAAGESGGRAVMTGQGLWPLSDESRSLLTELAAPFDLIDVRDEPSVGAFGSGASVSCLGDDLFLDLGPHLYAGGGLPDDLPDVMICFQSDLLDMPLPVLASFVTESLETWGVTPDRVGVVEAIPGVDREVFALIEPELKGARFYPAAEILSSGLPAAAGQRWLTTRFHMHLMAAAAGASGVAVSINRDYYANKHRSLLAQGSPWTLVEDLGEPAPSPSLGGFDPATVAAMRQAKETLAAKIYS